MRRIGAVAIAVAFFLGLGEAQAVTSGTIRCVGPQGTFDGYTVTLPLVSIYNPNSSVQSIRQVSIRDADGILVFDSGPLPSGQVLVPGYAWFPILAAELTGSEGGLLIQVKWSQGADKRAPIVKVNLLHGDQTYVTSVSQSECQ